MRTFRLNVYWASLNHDSIDGPRTTFQIWRTREMDWEDSTVTATIHVFSWERHLVIRKTGLLDLLGFTQAVLIPQIGEQSPEVVALDGPVMPDLEPLSDDEQPTSNPSVDGEAVERAWQRLQHPPPLPPLAEVPSPAQPIASLATGEDDLPDMPSPASDRAPTSLDTSPVSSLLQLTPPPSSQRWLPSSQPEELGELGDSDTAAGEAEAGPSNAALAALWDSPGAVVLPLFPTTPVVRRKRRRINQYAREGLLIYPPSPIDLTNDSE